MYTHIIYDSYIRHTVYIMYTHIIYDSEIRHTVYIMYTHILYDTVYNTVMQRIIIASIRGGSRGGPGVAMATPNGGLATPVATPFQF